MNYIFVDMDGTLLKTDLLMEQVWKLIRTRPLILFGLPFLLIFGKLQFKRFVSNNSKLQVDGLPYNKEVLDFIQSNRENKSTRIILISASPIEWVKSVSDHFGMFDEAHGSVDVNLKGHQKVKFISDHYLINKKVDRIIYIGNDTSDLQVWKICNEVVAVNPPKSVKKIIKKWESRGEKKCILIENRKHSVFRLLIKQMRVYQWIKNLLLFLPLIAAHQLFDSFKFAQSTMAFASFSLIASFVYIFNDLIDIEYDRKSLFKKNRPVASGELPLQLALLIQPFLFVFGLSLAYLVNYTFLSFVLFYLFLNIGYSFYLKKIIVLDIIVLTFMYTLRILAGGASTETSVSNWLLSFSNLFFFSLATLKRFTEAYRSKENYTSDFGRGYLKEDSLSLFVLGVGSGLLSILVIILYLQSEDIKALYQNPQFFWLILPSLLYYQARLWILANRDLVHDDPILFTIKDFQSWILLILIGLIFIGAL